MNVRKIALVGIPVLIVLLAIGAILGNSMLQKYLQGEEFRKFVSQKTSGTLRKKGDFAPLHWSGWSVYADEFSAQEEDNSVLRKLTARQIRAQLNWRAVFSGVWQLDDITISNLDIALAPPAAINPVLDLSTTLPKTEAPLPSWVPTRVAINGASIESASIQFPGGAVQGMKTTLQKDNTGWQILARGGRFKWAALPENDFTEFNARWNERELFLTKAVLRFRGGGTLQANGEYQPSTDALQLRTDWKTIPLALLTPERFKNHFTGTLDGNATTTGSPGKMKEWKTQGTFLVNDGVLQKIEMFDALATFTRSPQFRQIALHEMSGKLIQDATGTKIENFVMESRGLLRIEGHIFVHASGALRGTLQVGLTPQTLQWIPGSQEIVFKEARNNYRWTSIELGGTLDHPSENLTHRIATATVGEVIGAGMKILKPATETAVEGAKILKPATETAVEGVKGIMKDVLPLFP